MIVKGTKLNMLCIRFKGGRGYDVIEGVGF